MKTAYINWLVGLAVFLYSWTWSAQPVLAQVSTASAQTTVTATVEDSDPPTTPILVSPTNNSYVTTNTPHFVWESSTDDNGIDHYRLSLDGATLFDSIPTSDVDNSNYTLTYDSFNDEYTLAPKSGFTQGSHTWKIGAYDTLGNLTESATWTFIVDTQAPTFVMTQLGDQTVSISAQDSSTIPSSPVTLGANEPLLAGNGENSSTVQLTLTIPGDPTQNHSFSISNGGSWSRQLGILPRDVVMTLDFVITDLAGNVSVLSGVEFIIPTEVIVIPPQSPSPTPTPGVTPEPTASPGTTPGTTESQPGASPSPSPFSISIPVLPPREILNEAVQELTERFISGNALVQALPEEVREAVKESLSTIAPISAVVATTAVPVVATFALASQFGGGLSLDITVKILQALGLLPAGKPQGLVFESTNYEPVSFAVLSLTSEDQDPPLTETVVTDVNGIYKGIRVPPGKYKIAVNHQDYRFPTLKARPSYLKVSEYYKGEVFDVTGRGQEQLLLIPVDKISELAKKSLKRRLQILATQISRQVSVLVVPVFVVSVFLAILFPTVWNITMCVLYSGLVSRRLIAWFKTPLITGTVVDENGQPIERAIIRLSISGSDELTSLLATDKDGNFTMFADKGKYQLSVTKPGYIWYDQASPLSSYEVNATITSQSLVVTMKPMETVYMELGL